MTGFHMKCNAGFQWVNINIKNIIQSDRQMPETKWQESFSRYNIKEYCKNFIQGSWSRLKIKNPNPLLFHKV